MMEYMYMVIVIGDFNDKYGNNTTCIVFSLQDTVITAIIVLNNITVPV